MSPRITPLRDTHGNSLGAAPTEVRISLCPLRILDKFYLFSRDMLHIRTSPITVSGLIILTGWKGHNRREPP
jgi:hypothetical protein